MDTRSLPEPPVAMLSKLMDISALRQDTPALSYWVLSARRACIYMERAAYRLGYF